MSVTRRFAGSEPPLQDKSASPDIEFVAVSKRFGAVAAVEAVDLQVPPGSFFTFLGPSGCGKTTSLRLIAGFEQPTSGDVRIGGRSMVGVPPYRRPVNMVFQHYALFPHLDVAANIAYGLRQRPPRPSAVELGRQVDAMLELVRLPGYGARRVWQLSGGQQQRVALARALINRPTVLLLDEPLAALDRKLRRDMQIELQNLQHQVGVTFVLVTHDQEEALSMSDTICIMRAGRIVQQGSPAILYDAPASAWVADFVGKTNFLRGSVAGAADGRAGIAIAGRVFQGRLVPGHTALAPGDPAVLAIRPEMVRLAPPTPGDAATGRVLNRIFLGEHTEYLIRTQALGDILALVPRAAETDTGFAPGGEVALAWPDKAPLALADDREPN
jgi:spermidine/putrescine transport system ATP-binding protein